jgi:hypothetical protein
METKRKEIRKGFALILVIVIAAMMMIPVLMLLSSVVPRRAMVSGEAVSDKVLALTDSVVDNILSQVNAFPFTVSGSSRMQGYVQEEDGTVVNPGTVDASSQLAQSYVVYYYVSKLNGGVVPTIPEVADASAIAQFNSACANISEGVSVYLYNQSTQEYYVVWDSGNNKIASVSTVGPEGAVGSGDIKSLNSGMVTTMAVLDPGYKTNGVWIEADTNTKYEADKWNITATSYLLSKPQIKRTVQAVASRGATSSSLSEVPDGSWFTHTTVNISVPGHSFADYSGLYHTNVHFGKNETITGVIRSDGSLYMGGTALDPVFANNRVYDEAVDDYNGNHDGKFGADKKNLTWAKQNGYATEGYPVANWARVDLSLYGSNNNREPTDPNGGIQDKVLTDYYINGDATVIFNVEGTVTINNNTFAKPINGVIFVEGTATVEGTVKGQWSVGASKINIGGNILYVTPPRLDRNAPLPVAPDLLGLISRGDITITANTFDLNHHLEIDAAMISKTGNFGIDPNTSSHSIDASGTFKGIWSGSQACWNTSNAPLVVLGNGKVKGYDVQDTNYDWNLRDWGVPPFYPTTTSTTEAMDLVDKYPIVTDVNILNFLRSLKKADLISTGDMTYPYKYIYNGETYYYGGSFNWSVIVTMAKTSLYRISWKEQIAKPVKP